MATAKVHECTLCKDEDINNTAVTWCTECETFLCNDCDRYHGRIKASKAHKTVNIETYKLLPDFIVKIKNRCEEHYEMYELFCPFHDCACCVFCITEKHEKCQNMRKLSDVLSEVKSSASVVRLGDDLKDLKGDLEKILTYLSGRIDSFQINKSADIEEIKTVRKSLNKHLDMLEKQMLDSYETEHCKLESKTKEIISEIDTRMKRIEQLQDDFSKIKQYGTDLQTYLGLTNIENMAASEAKYIKILQSGSHLKEQYIEIKISDDIHTILKTIKSFGNVSLSSVPGKLELKANPKVQAQQNITKSLTVDQIKPALKCKIQQIPVGHLTPIITGCQILSKGELLFVDESNKCLLLFSKDGEFIRKVLTFSGSPFDICHVNDDTVAVTVWDRREVVMVDIEKNKQIKTIKVCGECFGIDSNGEQIMVRIPTSGVVLVLDVDGNILNRLCIPGQTNTGISIFGDKIYCVDWKNNTIICYGNDGKYLQTIENKSIREARGIGVDNHGIIYVACRRSNDVLAFSPNGKDMKVILSHEDGLKEPYGLHIDRKKHMLLVSNIYNGNAFLYQL